MSLTRHVCGACWPRLDNFGMDFIPSKTLYVNVRHHRFFLEPLPDQACRGQDLAEFVESKN